MSRFLYYFEDKNKDSVFYDGFAEVGNFIIPDSINQGYKDFSFDSKILKVGIIASGYSANPFFQAKENEKLINKLRLFIEKRQENRAINSYLACAVESNSAEIIELKVDKVISIENFKDLFQKQENWCVRII